MRIGMIIQTYHPHIGGAERQLAALAPRMTAAGHEVAVFTRQFASDLPRFETVDGIPVHRVLTPGPKAIASLAYSIGAQPVLRRFRPDILHVHGLLSAATTALLAKRLQGTPFVAKAMTGGQFGEIYKLHHRRTGKWRGQQLARHTDRFVAISQEIYDELDQLDVPPARRVMIPNGVDIDRFEPVTMDKKRALRRQLNLPDGPLVIFCGRLTRQKRLDLLLQVWSEVQSLHPSAQLLLLGTGEEELALRRLAGKNVIFGGRQPDVAPFLQASDLFVLPSDSEGLSNAMLEAMASGLPVIVTEVGAAPQLLASGQAGRLIQPGDKTQLFEALDSTLSTPHLLPLMGEHGREIVLRDYSLESVVQRLLQLYTAVINGEEPLQESLKERVRMH